MANEHVRLFYEAAAATSAEAAELETAGQAGDKEARLLAARLRVKANRLQAVGDVLAAKVSS